MESKKTKNFLKTPKVRLRVLRQCRNRGSLLPPYDMNAAKGEATHQG